MPVAAHPDDCTACLLCEMICPDMAIHVDWDHAAGDDDED